MTLNDEKIFWLAWVRKEFATDPGWEFTLSRCKSATQFWNGNRSVSVARRFLNDTERAEVDRIVADFAGRLERSRKEVPAPLQMIFEDFWEYAAYMAMSPIVRAAIRRVFSAIATEEP